MKLFTTLLTTTLLTTTLLTTTLLTTAFLATVFTTPRASAEETKPMAAPAWELKDVNGKTVKSSDFEGKIVVLDFWATWCPPCREEIPGFVELQKEFGDKGVVVIGVSLDEQGPAVVKPFMEKLKINYPIVMGDEKTVAAFGGIEGIPTTFIIDRKGMITAKHVGFRPKTDFVKEIELLLAKK